MSCRLGLCVFPHVSQVRNHGLWWLQGSWGDAAHHLTLRQEKLENEQETSLILFRPLEVAHAVMTCADYRS